RDFVVSRLKREINGKRYCIARSIEIPELPETKERVRGIVHLGAGRFVPHSTKENTTCIDLILCMDLKGMLPKTIVNTVMARLMEKDYEQQLRYFERVRDQKLGKEDANNGA
uniref:START domain-containing protein n=1 Tax=Acrobeloides nanus TaxID=290746 RepID=A0A914CUS7_9BILA